MDKDINKFLYDIKVSIQSINSYLEGKRSLEAYEGNKMLRRAIERELEIVGIAIIKIHKIDKQFPISEIMPIRGLRNRIAHEYDGIDNTIIWDIIINYLPPLLKEIEAHLSQ